MRTGSAQGRADASLNAKQAGDPAPACHFPSTHEVNPDEGNLIRWVVVRAGNLDLPDDLKHPVQLVGKLLV